jgi:NAD(P)-dependent dehydrogenase (short-subunit alcohol dehydrogenase family)
MLMPFQFNLRVAFVGHPKLVDYTSTKGAIVGFTRALSNQLVKDKGIRVNCVVRTLVSRVSQLPSANLAYPIYLLSHVLSAPDPS